nr:tetratricopeptide repeat protein [Candidatus Krumholzibacteria bacterium]
MTLLAAACCLLLLVAGPLSALAQNDEPTREEKIAELNAKVMANPADSKSWNDLGVIYAQNGEFEVARDAFIRAVQGDPTQGDYHRNLGLAFSRLDMYDVAVAEFQAYQRLDTMGGRDYWRLIGSAQVNAGMVDEARVTYQEGLKVLGQPANPEGMRLVLALNKLEAEAGNEQAARSLLEKYTPQAAAFLRNQIEDDAEGTQEAQSIIHNRVTMMVEDAKLMEESGLLDEASALYEGAYELAPQRDDLLPRLVAVDLKNGDSMKARVAARLARDAHPEKSGTWIATGKVYESTNRLEDAVAAYEKAYSLEEIDDLRVAIGNLHMRLGNDTEASKWLRAGVSADSTKPEVVYNYAISQMREKKYHAAIASLRSVVQQRPDMVQGWSALAQCLRATKQYGAAVAPYQKVLEMAPEAKVAYNLGYCAMKAKQHSTAIDAYGKALEMDPTMVEARYNLSLTFMNAGRYEEAAASFEAMKELEPDSYRVYYSQGLSYYYLGEYDAALEAYDMAFAQKETVNVLNNMGLVYDKLGDKKEAAKLYKQAKALKAGG